MEPQEYSRIVDGVIFAFLFSLTLLIISSAWRLVFAPFVAIIGVLTFHVLNDPDSFESSSRFSWPSRPSITVAFSGIHLLILAFWLTVPPATSLLFIDWGQMGLSLATRGIISTVYIILVPGTLVVDLLSGHRLSLLEFSLIGILVSLFITSLISYALYTLNLNLMLYVFPVFWAITSLLIILSSLKHAKSKGNFPISRPSSFPSVRVSYLFLGIIGLFLTSVAVVNITWYALVRGDLWTHIAQTTLFIQGSHTVNYPWVYHFLLSTVWAISGLPLINALQILQTLTILPILAFFVTLRAYSGSDSKIAIIGTLFYACFMGLAWISYFWLNTFYSPSTLAAKYNVEFIASSLTYDALLGIFALRILFLPATISIACVVYATRLLRGHELQKLFLVVTSLILTALSLESHLFETVFFIAVLALSAVFVGEWEQLKLVAFCDIGAALGFSTVGVIEYLSPVSQRLIFGSSTGNGYLTGFLYSVYVLAAAIIFLTARISVMRMEQKNLDPLEWVYDRIERTLIRLEGRILSALMLTCLFLALFIGEYTLTHQPFFVWEVADSGIVPWNYYPFRIGVITLFAIFGTSMAFLRLSSIRKILEFVFGGVTALVVGRGLDLFGNRPLGFGESRVMDVLWFPVSALAAFGFIGLAPRMVASLAGSEQKRKFIGAALVLVVLFSGMTSFLLLLDGKMLDGQSSGYALTSGDLQVVEYVIHHPEIPVYSITSPTIQSQRKLRDLTLTFPYGYSNQFYLLPGFASQSIGGFVSSFGVLNQLRIFAGSYDISSLSSSGSQPALWYLAYAPEIVHAGGSFLLSPLVMSQPTNSGVKIVDSVSNTQIEEFFTLSAFGLSQSTYSLLSLSSALQSTSGTVILTSDPTDAGVYNATLKWVQSQPATLVVVANTNSSGLFERQLFGAQTSSVHFSASYINGSNSGASFSTFLPTQVDVNSVTYPGATILADYSAPSYSSPLIAMRPSGLGRVFLFQLRDYFTLLERSKFTDLGTVLFGFLPSLFMIAAAPPIYSNIGLNVQFFTIDTAPWLVRRFRE